MNLPFAEDLADFFSNPLNYFLFGNEIFALKSWLLRPYPGNLTDSQKVLKLLVVQIATHNRKYIWHISISLANFSSPNQSEGRKCPKLQSCSDCFTCCKRIMLILVLMALMILKILMVR